MKSKIQIQSQERTQYLKKIKKQKYLVLLTQILVLVIFLAVWELLARAEIIDSFIKS